MEGGCWILFRDHNENFSPSPISTKPKKEDVRFSSLHPSLNSSFAEQHSSRFLFPSFFFPPTTLGFYSLKSFGDHLPNLLQMREWSKKASKYPAQSQRGGKGTTQGGNLPVTVLNSFCHSLNAENTTTQRMAHTKHVLINVISKAWVNSISLLFRIIIF